MVVLDGELQPAQVHALLQEASLVNMVLAGRVVEDHLQLSRVSSLRQQVLGEHLALLCQLLIVVPKAKQRKLRKRCANLHVCRHLTYLQGHLN